jgi:hypothetical protein
VVGTPLNETAVGVPLGALTDDAPADRVTSGNAAAIRAGVQNARALACAAPLTTYVTAGGPPPPAAPLALALAGALADAPITPMPAEMAAAMSSLRDRRTRTLTHS